MFIISENSKTAIKAIHSYKNILSDLHNNFSEIFEINLNKDKSIYWFSAKPQDQLHIFKNAVVVGKLRFDEKQIDQPIYHKNEILESFINLNLDPLLSTTIIYFDESNIEVIPNETTSIYYSKQSISDFQLLIAKTENLWPSPVNTQILAGVGYFPGNMTLFENIKKIPYLFKLKNDQLIKVDDFTPSKHNDKNLVNRLVDIVPGSVNQSLAMSGGLDSRFVLGILMKSGIKPKLFSLDGKEKPIVQKVANTYDLELQVDDQKHIKHHLYTLMTDARIYFRGGNYSKMISEYQAEGIIHYGFCLLPYNENSFASAWKKPSIKSNLYDDLINYALLPRVPTSGFTQFKTTLNKTNMFKVLKEEMKFGIDSYTFKLKTKKEIATWFYHLARGLTWTYAHLSDLSFFKYPVFLLGDKKACEIGFRSSAYSNFNKERLRKINQKLFTDSNIDYSDNRSFKSLPPVIKDISKIYNEFFKKLIARYKGIKNQKPDDSPGWFDNIKPTEAKSFNKYFSVSYKNIIDDEKINFSLKRAAVTINDTLIFLEK
jgi:hypothetical protein